ncbi:hypothetical protein FDB41_15095 [Clostridium botulinum]|nr:hypothetical protein [Clostridium botulinum]NFO54835.1 hypothetical protein [Clostridium botulinum]
MDIEKLRKEMTREEFLNDRSLTNNEGCPNEYELKEYEPCKGIMCKECWRNAVKDIKFKDDMEDKKLNKELNILQAIEMPIGTEFEVKLKKPSIILKDITLVGNGKRGRKTFINSKINKALDLCEDYFNAKFIPLTKPVSFMEALESGKKVKVKCEGYFDIDKNYYLISEIFEKIIKGNEVFGENETEKAIKSFVTNGQWYIHEDNAND